MVAVSNDRQRMAHVTHTLVVALTYGIYDAL